MATRSEQTRTDQIDSRPAFMVGQLVSFGGLDSVVGQVGERAGARAYLIENGGDRLEMWIPEGILIEHQAAGRPTTEFREVGPDLVVVDDFFHDPDQIRAIALAQDYGADLRYYKGLRSRQRFLWPWLREAFGRLLGREVTVWTEHAANGVFQQTGHEDPLVWHHDSQTFAAAVYLTPNSPPSSGTSFWRDRVHGCRRSPDHPLEVRRLGSPDAIQAARDVVYAKDSVTHPDTWELIESVAGLYNRLVIWDAKLFHSATSYEDFGDAPDSTRLVQLFFFDAS